MVEKFGPHPLTGPLWRPRIEQAVSDHLGRPWDAREFTDLSDRASHACGLLSDGVVSVFAKLSSGANAVDQLDVEQTGLKLLRTRAGIATAQPIAVLPDAQAAVIVVQSVSEIARGPAQWRDIGRLLAQLHKVSREAPGLESHGYFGPLYQDNRPLPDWPAFYAERRLLPMVVRGIDSGHLTMDMARKVERIVARLPALCGPPVPMALLHGDAQQNNFISTTDGAVLIDHAAHYGHPEVDLAMVGYFEEAPDAVLDGYREILPIDPGFAGRRDLWRLYGYLAVVATGAESYVPQWRAAVERYL